MKVVTRLFLFALLISLTVPALAQQNEEQQRKHNYAIVAQIEGIKTYMIAHSNTDYDMIIGRIGIEKWFSSWWSLRLEIEPLMLARSDIRDDREAAGFAVVWSAYFDEIGKWEPFFSAELGLAYWGSRDFPIEPSLQYNFTIAFSGGGTYAIDDHNGLQLGLRYWHLSNNNWGERNPGLNGFGIFAGYRYLF